MNNLSLDQLKRAIQISGQIERLQAQVSTLLGQGCGAKRGRKPGSKNVMADGGDVGNEAPEGTKKARKTKRTMSPEAREKIAAAQRMRWAKQKRNG